MSKIKVNKIENTSTADGGVEIDVDGHVTIDGQQLPTAGPLSNRNLIINGAMQVAQRSTSESSVTGDDYRTCDRYRISISNLGTWTISQSTNAPADFVNSLRIECTTADASPAANDYIAVFYHVEAQDVSWINYGTADAKPLMLSFYVRSNKTSSGSFAIRQRDNSNKLFSKVYAFNGTQDIWKKIEIPIPADTAGLIDNDNGPGLTLEWWLNGGSTFTGGGATTGWEAFDDTKRNPTNAGIGGTVGDYFEITGVQLEVGSKSTPFEHRSYGDELQRCQRYYYKTMGDDPFESLAWAGHFSTTYQYVFIKLPTSMRAEPGVDLGGSLRIIYYEDSTNQNNSTDTWSIGNIQMGASGGYFRLNTTGTWANKTAGSFIRVDKNNDANAFFSFDSEL